ncbi:hypothetical protein [uncultured Litoreibacter sp.]|uniref:hypothetical protein n=1 Tax=uncultured Litoreibacter sp. TaxID=1392394 RepID=UPI00262AFEC4|nr:hypothetical protein [uncultured Litoreibacter sp.]
MFEKIKYKSPLITASTPLLGFFFYIGSRLQSGESMSGSRGFLRWIAEGLTGLAEMFGPAAAGYGVMGVSLFCGVFAAVWIWRDPMM